MKTLNFFALATETKKQEAGSAMIVMTCYFGIAMGLLWVAKLWLHYRLKEKIYEMSMVTEKMLDAAARAKRAKWVLFGMDEKHPDFRKRIEEYSAVCELQLQHLCKAKVLMLQTEIMCTIHGHQEQDRQIQAIHESVDCLLKSMPTVRN